MIRWLGREAGLPPSRTPGFLTRLRTNSAGTTLALAGAALVPIAGMIGSGLDMARGYMAQAKLQNACDAAALAARHEMYGAVWNSAARIEGQRFFDFNFPASTMAAQNVTRTVRQSSSDPTTVEVLASADIPTTVMSLFGKEVIPIRVECQADQDYGNNDIMVVLDVTGSMKCRPGVSGGCSTEQSGSKIGRLRTGAIELYRALAGATNTRTRYGFMPYSVSVNVARDLNSNWVRNPASYYQCTVYKSNGTCKTWGLVSVSHTNSWLNTWRGNGSYTSNMDRGCVEERATIGQSGSPIRILTTVSRNDIDLVSTSNTARQWSPYDETAEQAESATYCPRPARRLATYANETVYQTEINRATGFVDGSTYHDVGMIWAARYLSSTGMFASSNPTMFNNVPVTQHIVFLTDGTISTSGTVYSAYGVNDYDNRMPGSGSLDARHVARFQSACTAAKSMGITIWVIALDVADTTDIQPCATSSGHFYVSDGTDLDQVFARIGQGIGRLRLTE